MQEQDRYYDGYSEFIEDEFGDEIKVTSSDKYFDYITGEYKIWDYPLEKLGEVAEKINTSLNVFNRHWDIAAAIEMNNRNIPLENIENIQNVSKILQGCDISAQENNRGSNYLINLIDQTLNKYIETKKVGHMSYSEVYNKLSEMYYENEPSERLHEVNGNNLFVSIYNSKLGLEMCEITEKELDSMDQWEIMAAFQMNNRDIHITNMESIKGVSNILKESDIEAREQGQSFEEIFDKKMNIYNIDNLVISDEQAVLDEEIVEEFEYMTRGAMSVSKKGWMK